MECRLTRARKVLVVDDLEAMRKLIARNLEQIGCRQVLQAENGLEALSLLERVPGIEALITDWNMPLMTGLELLQKVRAHPRLAALPVLMVTGEMSRPQVEEAIAAGVSNFLVKPFTAASLQARLGRMLAGSGEATVEVPRHCASDVRAPRRERAAVGPLPGAVGVDDAPDNAPCVLVVDDVADSIEALSGVLRGEYRVLAAASGEDALRVLAGARPDLILLDVMMPGMGGFELCRRLQADPERADIPVIFLTAQDDAASIVDGLQLGAVDYIAKPAEPVVLRARVRGQIARRQAVLALQRQLRAEAENVRLREQVERMARHDLKSPIGGIINFADALLQEAGLSAEHQELVAAIHESAWSVLNLINLSLDLYRIERGEYRLHPVRVDLAQLIKRILKERQAELLAKRLHLALRAGGGAAVGGDGLVVDGDPLLSYSLFSNLIKNAVEATPRGGHMAIVIERVDSGMIEVRIRNDGAVPEDIRVAFFDKFSTSGKSGGTGFGTYSARMFAQAQGGSIGMWTSDDDNATELCVRLPLAED